jgi:hypothetical protein
VGLLRPLSLAALACVSCAAIVGIEDKDPYPVPDDGAADAAHGSEDATKPNIETVVADIPGVWGLAVDDTYLYFTSETSGTVHRRAAGAAPETIARDQAEPREIHVDGTHVYWHAWNTTGRTEIDGGGEVPILVAMSQVDIGGSGAVLVLESERAASIFRATGIAPVDDGFLVVAGPTQVLRYRRTQSGGVGDVAVTSGPYVRAPSGVAADDTHFYWYQQNTFDLWRRPKASTGASQPPPERFSALPGTPDVSALLADPPALYFVTGGGIAAKVVTAVEGGAPDGEAGSPMIELANGFPSPRYLTADGRYLYFTRGDVGGEVVAVPKAGGQGKVLASGQNRPKGIAVRSDGMTSWVYWAANGDGVIRRVAAPP